VLATLVYGYDQRGHQLAVEAAKAQATLAKADEISNECQELEWRIGHLQSAREKTQKQLAEKRLELSHVETHLLRLRQQADRLRMAIREIERQAGAKTQQHADAEAELDRVQRSIATISHDLLQKERALRDRPATYSIVPYEGPNQTRRRPIYIECRRDAVVIQPEKIVFREHDFDPPLGPGNPLAASLRAYCEHLNDAGRTNETTRAYPLLLVRPDGIEAYYAARAALQSWGTEFGYELVGADWALDFPPMDRQLATNLEQVAADARVRQEALAIEAPRQYKRPRVGLRASSKGGFVADGTYDGSTSYGGNGFAARRGHGDRYSASRRSEGNGWGTESSDDMMPPRGGVASNAGLENRVADGTPVGSSELGDETGGGSPGRSTGNVERGATSAFGSQASRNSNESLGDDAFGLGGTTGPTGTLSSTGTNEQATIANDGPALGSPTGESNGGGPSHSLAGPSGGQGENPFGAFGSPGVGFQADSTNSQAAGSGAAQTGGEPGKQIMPSGGSSSEISPPPGMQSSPMIAAVEVPRKKPKSLAGQRGQDWGLPDASRNATPITRPILIRCEPNQLTILPDDDRSASKTIPLGARTEDSVDPLVSSIWDHMKGWGLAGRGLYWRPTLSLDVRPGAEGRFSELQALLSGSGLEVRQRERKLR
jgi:hypothetical protein